MGHPIVVAQVAGALIASIAATFVAMHVLRLLPGLYGRFRFALLNKRAATPDDFMRMSWSDFELVVAHAYRAQGYLVEPRNRKCGDGGVDIIARRRGETILIQCNQWRNLRIGRKTVQEVAAIVSQIARASGVVISAGEFTDEAQEFALGSRITLVDGQSLMTLVNRDGSQTAAKLVPEAVGSPSIGAAASVPVCPECGELMVLRKPRNPSALASEFWACSRFPACLGEKAA
jgi:restriction system protein